MNKQKESHLSVTFSNAIVVFFPFGLFNFILNPLDSTYVNKTTATFVFAFLFVCYERKCWAWVHLWLERFRWSFSFLIKVIYDMMLYSSTSIETFPHECRWWIWSDSHSFCLALEFCCFSLQNSGIMDCNTILILICVPEIFCFCLISGTLLYDSPLWFMINDY